MRRTRLAVSACVAVVAFAASQGIAADSYQFPIVPGTPAWRALRDHDAMIAATQVPPQILSTMSTAGVIETCLNHPLLIDLSAYSTPQGGFDGAGTRFNVIQELLARPDAGEQLLLQYAAIDPAALNATPMERADLAARIGDMELIFAQQAILRSMTRAQRFELLRAAVRMADAKAQYVSAPHLSRTALLIGRTLEEQDLLAGSTLWAAGNRPRTDKFLRSGFGVDPVLVKGLIDLARSTAQTLPPQ